jgi:hypothetical protein
MDSTMTRTTPRLHRSALRGAPTAATAVHAARRRLRPRLGGAVLAIVSAVAICLAATPAGAGSQTFGSEEFGLTFKQLVKKAEAVEDHIAKCMQQAGFDYVANDFDSIRRAMNADKSAPGLSESEYRRQYGFGISTQFEKPIVKLGLGEENAATREGLPPAEQEAYDRTLLGEHTEEVFANALEAEDFSRTGGCTRKAVKREFTKKELSASYINPGDQKVDQDPRVKVALQKYAKCMSRAGFDYQTPDDAESDIQTQYDAIVGTDDPQSLDAARATRLTDLQNAERAIAEASFRCETKYIEPVKEKVEKEIFGHLPK